MRDIPALTRRATKTHRRSRRRDLGRLGQRRVERLQHDGDRLIRLVAHVRDAEGLSLQLPIAAIDHELVLRLERLVQRGEVDVQRVLETVQRNRTAGRSVITILSVCFISKEIANSGAGKGSPLNENTLKPAGRTPANRRQDAGAPILLHHRRKP